MFGNEPSILVSYIPVFIIFAVAMVLGAGQMILGVLVGPKKPSATKLMPYECGIDPIGEANVRQNVKFSLVALLFLIFDVEGIFIILWAIVFNSGVTFSSPGLSFQMFAFVEMLVFMVILVAGYVYVWRKGALEWI